MQLDLEMSNLILMYGLLSYFMGVITILVVCLLDKFDVYISKKYKERKEKKENENINNQRKD